MEDLLESYRWREQSLQAQCMALRAQVMDLNHKVHRIRGREARTRRIEDGCMHEQSAAACRGGHGKCVPQAGRQSAS